MLVDGTNFGSMARKAATLAAVAATLLFGAATADAYTTANGWVASDYVTGFGHDAGAGPVGLVFDGSANLLVTDNYTATLHKVAPGGGTAAGSKIQEGYGQAAGLAFGKDGRLYLARGNQHDVVELNPASGDVLRTVASDLPCPVGLATDPISGDLFVSNVFCKGGGIMRITGFANGPGRAHRYAGTQDADGLTFAPDGALYAAGGNQVVRIAGTNSSNPGSVSDVAAVPAVDGIVYAPATATSDEYLVVVRNDGQIDRVDFNGGVTPVLTGTSRGDLVTVGPDRCIYADLQDRVIKLGPSTGTCNFAAPVQPGLPNGDNGGSGGVLAERVARRVVDVGVKSSAPKRVRRGRRFTLKLTITNRSGTPAHTVVVSDKLAKATRFIGTHAPKGVSCHSRRGTVTCRKATLGAHRSFVVQIVLRALRSGRYSNRATVKSNDLDPAPGNNRAKATIRIRAR